MKTYCEFKFEAAHSVPPYSGLHDHTFVAKLTFGGVGDPAVGWPAHLYEVKASIAEFQERHGAGIGYPNLDHTAETGVASPENITKDLWTLFRARFPSLEEVEFERGFPETIEGCIRRGEVPAPISLAA
jgi:6-pyruvoyltetrahydropterin/6-carboxytetrahydropterin synthase